MISTELRRFRAPLLAASLLWPTILWAQTPPAAPPLLRCDRDDACNRGFEQAQRLIKANKRQEALDSLTALYESYRDEWLMLPIARQEHILGRFAAAEQHYQRWIAADVETDPARVAVVKRYLEEVRQQLAAEKHRAAAQTPAAAVPTSPPQAAVEPNLTVQQGALVQKAESAAPKPLYRRGWFWGVLGGSAAVALGLGLGLGLGLNRGPNYINVVASY